MMANGHVNPRLMESSRFKSWIAINTNPITKNPMLNCLFVALSISEP